MMATPQPTPQQPIYPDQLRFELDRVYNRITDYVEIRIEKVLSQMRVDRQESVIRDEGLLRRIENMDQRLERVESTQRVIIDTQREIIASLQSMQQQMSDGFAAQAERHNELMVRVERLERNSNPPSEGN